MNRRFALVLGGICSGLILPGCQDATQRAIVWLFYREARLPAKQIQKDLRYRTGVDAHPQKHLLDLYLPHGTGWPVLLFVHGGSWSSGDKALVFGGADPYANIGRFYASQGIGVAAINYRLQPEVTWREQVQDVARALAWLRGNVRDYGGNPDALFLFGHSAGAQLATRAALQLNELGLPKQSVCGVIAVSGIAFDLMDDETYRLGMDPAFLARHFSDNREDQTWKTEASSVGLIEPSAPPFLLMYGRWEWKSLQRQNQLMHHKLEATGVPSSLVVTPWDQHFLIIASLSHPHRSASRAIIDFVRGTACDRHDYQPTT